MVTKYTVLDRDNTQVDNKYSADSGGSGFDQYVESPVSVAQSFINFAEGIIHICHNIRTASMANTAPNKAPPGMCSQKKTGSMNNFSQTDARSMITPIKGSTISQIRILWLMSRKMTRMPMRIKIALIPKI